MKKLCILALLLLSLVSCGSYTYSGYRVKSVLAITEKGDTIQVPYSTLERNFRYDYNFYTDWRFNYGGYWYNWNVFPYYYQPRYDWRRAFINYRPSSRPQVKPKTRPRVNTPRGSRSNYTPRTPQRIQRNTTPTRTRTTPNVQTRVNVGRSSTGGRRNNQ